MGSSYEGMVLTETLLLGAPVICTGFLLISFYSPTVYPEAVTKAEQVCASNDGWERLEVNSADYLVEASCKNGAKFVVEYKD